jgi:acetylornithine deacetylase
MNVTDLLSQLISIESVNPDLVPNAVGEGEVGAFIAEWFAQRGIEVVTQAVSESRFNVIARVRGTGGGKNLMLNAHIDTVGAGDMQDAFIPRVEGKRLYGRGSYDMKGALAACMLTLLNAKQLQLRGDVLLSAVVDEEYASIGTEALLKEWQRWSADAVIVTEPTELEICIAHKGFVWLDVETIGRSAHGSRPHLGIDAIVKMGKFLAELDALNANLAHTQHPLLGSGSIHASLIEGGEAMSVYPASCRVGLERRTIPNESVAQVVAEIEGILNRLKHTDPQFEAKLTVTMERPYFGIEPNAPIVNLITQVVNAQQNRAAQPLGISFWMDTALFSQAGIPTVVYGPHGEGAHAAVEWVDLASVEACIQVYTEVAKHFCA